MKRCVLVPLALLLAAGCSDSNNNNNTPAPVQEPPPNTVTVNTELTGEQVIAGRGVPTGSATAELTVDLDDGTVTGTVTFTDVEPTAVSLDVGYAGEPSQGQLVMLDAMNATTFTIPADTVLTEADFELFNAGALHFRATTADHPDGALRGQLVPDGIELFSVPMSGSFEVPPVDSMALGRADVTLARGTGRLVIHLNVIDLDAGAAHIHSGIAGTNGAVLIGLEQDPDDAGHWSADDVLDADGLAALDSGRLYVNAHTAANAGGEIRGQIVPDGIEVVLTLLTGLDVVTPAIVATAVDTMASAIAATTIDGANRMVSIHVNTIDFTEATGVRLRQAPVGQNGPVVADLTQDTPDNLPHWLVDDVALSADEYLALQSQGLYLTVESAAFPDGEIRGQIVPEGSSPGGPEVFLVESVAPANGAELATFPSEVRITFNRAVFAESVTATSARVTRSGGDGSFGDGNEEVVAPVARNVTDAEIQLDFTGVTVPDDVFRVRVVDVTDTNGAVLDGDSNGDPGGTFLSTFMVVTTAPPAPTLSQLQAEVFTPNCTASGCHSGAAPAAGQNLTAGQTFASVVNVPSTEQPNLLRVNPGNPDDSYLVHKIEHRTTISGDPMPLFAPMLPNGQIQDVREWIEAGAQDN